MESTSGEELNGEQTDAEDPDSGVAKDSLPHLDPGFGVLESSKGIGSASLAEIFIGIGGRL